MPRYAINKNFRSASLCCLIFVLGDALAENLNGFVSRVYDGDTITLRSEDTTKNIRLAGIDAPELKQPYGIVSRDALSQDVLNQSVTVDTNKTDKYGRNVGKLLLNGEDVNLKQVNMANQDASCVYSSIVAKH